MSERAISFHFRGAIRQVEGLSPTRTVLQYLREECHATGTKEGCAEGDCGACTVVIGEKRGDALQLRAVNACLQLLPMLDGKALFTVEDLAPLAGSGRLHPLQQALVEGHASQCGFCTPGFVMSLFALYENTPSCPSRDAVMEAISGNLCRCTGYRPIIDAMPAAWALPRVGIERSAVLAPSMKWRPCRRLNTASARSASSPPAASPNSPAPGWPCRRRASWPARRTWACG